MYSQKKLLVFDHNKNIYVPISNLNGKRYRKEESIFDAYISERNNTGGLNNQSKFYNNIAKKLRKSTYNEDGLLFPRKQ